ncbi:hypothetical protein KAFR_0A04530 [Kazachstania africana CBS 2517]|uniref:OPT superfamily oligopeptide transporter n=1 Tax=Kazachstania africana (strain ATCC 22294 / BCRC 22015 / CBS 2517 / CECT 1963 / NBRC 1671 / NRRL Y-8276) TaxID=1071382 RepID=H2AND8_KAZAF|nr:hypothetical protein KAFR_0A04530 [Kazachstania africana CBS 2517]CCF55888.1 hypothetical protein KAFR_0A04530 [Kazachstania africana CBS 2517]
MAKPADQPIIPSSTDEIRWSDKPSIRQVTWRATLLGFGIGSLVLISNFQFGLQTGWVSMMSLPSALLTVAFFRQIWPLMFPDDVPFTDVETVYAQSLSVAVGTGPLSFGFVGVIPAIEKFLTFEESGGSRYQGQPFKFSQLLVWSFSLAFFGIFFAVPLRKQVIVREKLAFPSGNATAVLISVLNGSEILQEISRRELLEMREKRLNNECPEVLRLEPSELEAMSSSQFHSRNESSGLLSGGNRKQYNANFEQEAEDVTKDSDLYNSNVSLLMKTFSISSLYTLCAYFVPILKELPIFGSYLSKTYLWNFQPSPAYIGQGIIMGLPTVSYMLFGAILGWGILGPVAKNIGWVSKDADVHDWEKGVQGWILWCSLSVMVADSLVGFIVISVKSFLKFLSVDDKSELLNDIWDDTMESMLLEEERALNMHSRSSTRTQETVRLVSREQEHEVDSKHLVQYTTVISGLIVSSLICIICIIYMFGVEIIPVYAMVSALLLALFLSILGVRALGETDLNPVSGIGKLSQLLFALIIPKDHKGGILVNLVAGGVAEAGAQQAGDLMQDLKTGHLLNASPRAQFIAQLLGATWSIVLSSAMYICYNKVYDLPNSQIRIPTAVVWIDCARLVTGQNLPERALECSLFLGIIFGLLSLVKNCCKGREDSSKWALWIPSGVAVGVGIYNAPSFTIARFIGGAISHIWLKRYKGDLSAKTKMIVFSSGLVLGEGIFSIFCMIFTSLDVPHF